MTLGGLGGFVALKRATTVLRRPEAATGSFGGWVDLSRYRKPKTKPIEPRPKRLTRAQEADIAVALSLFP